jgi:enamine deaminase RidA (YjgF/YER057c/UK114 family)
VDKRRSIEVSGVKHLNPIPAASRRGPFVVSGAISGADPASGTVPADLDAQCRQMFDNVRRLIEAAGGTPEDIVKMTVWIADRALRPTLNRYWVEMFPDPHSRPARHTVAHADFTPPMQIQCDLLAVVGED